MDNQNAINREMKKQQLRRQIVPNPADMQPAEKKEEAEQTSHSILAWIFLHKIFLCTIFLLLAAGTGGIFIGSGITHTQNIG